MAETEKPKEYLVNLRRVSGLLASNWGWIVASVVLMMVKRYCRLQENVLEGEIVDTYQKGRWDDFGNVTWRLTLNYLLVGALQAAESFSLRRIQAVIGRSLKTRLIKSLIIQKPLSFFDHHKSGDLASRITYDCDSVAISLGSLLPTIVSDLFQIIFGAYFMLSMDLRLSGIIALVLPVSFLASLLENYWKYPLQEASSKTVGDVNSDIVEAITQVRTIRTFNQQSRHLTSFENHLRSLDSTNVRLSIAAGFSNGLSILGYSLCMCASFWYGGSLVLNGQISTGQFLSFSLFATQLSGIVNFIPDLNTQLIWILVSAERVYSVIEGNDTSLYKKDDSEEQDDSVEKKTEQTNAQEDPLQSEDRPSQSPHPSYEHSSTFSDDDSLPSANKPTSEKRKPIPKSVVPPLSAKSQQASTSSPLFSQTFNCSSESVDDSRDPRLNADPSLGLVPPPSHRVLGHIKFNNVSFSYESRPDIKVLDGFHLEIAPGQRAALVGTSGGGKSTIVSLLSKFYEVDSGSITLDGLELARLQPNWLRNQIGLVSQEPVLFSHSIRYNICYGMIHSSEEGKMSVEVSQARLEEVSKMANAHDFIMSLPNGYDTTIGERGCMLSAGQRQRIAIARAMLRDPKILITDEATSALDNTSERVVQEALERLMIGRTCIVVAHRLSTIRQCFPICVLGKGHILEQGSHDELMAIPNGHYHRLHSYEQDKESLVPQKTTSETNFAQLTPSSDCSDRVISSDEIPEIAPTAGNPTDDAHSPRQRQIRQ